jgi:hypothetical protein
VEGESDTWTGWFHDIPTLGVPGKSIWKPDWAALLGGVELVVWQEPQAEDFAVRIGAFRPDVRVIEHPPYKDLSDAHLAGEDLPALMERLRASARPWSEIEAEHKDARRVELQQASQAVLDHPDPLQLVEQAIQGQGYGGDITPAVIVYLAVTSRLLAMQRGAMPVHLLILGSPSGGKSYTLDVVLGLMPAEGIHKITAGSARALIYDEGDLAHVALIYGEGDSIPTGDEDNPASSAIRALLQDHELCYDVTVRDSETGRYKTQKIRRPGPTVMLTTATRRLRDQQMATRMFELEVPEDIEKNRAALAVQALLNEHPAPPPDPALLAYQGYLQLRAPWNVSIPFLSALNKLIGQSPAAANSRVLRDSARVRSFVSTVTVLRHARRRRTPDGRLIAEIEDYEAIFSLVSGLYENTVTGATPGLRRVVAAVEAIGKPCNLQQVCNQMGSETNRGSVSRWIKSALKQGWLINDDPFRKNGYALTLGEPIPATTSLPTPAALREAWLQVASLTGESKDPRTLAVAYEL